MMSKIFICVAVLAIVAGASAKSGFSSCGQVEPIAARVGRCELGDEDCKVQAGQRFTITFDFIQAKQMASPIVRLEIDGKEVLEEEDRQGYTRVTYVPGQVGQQNMVWTMARMPALEAGKTVNLKLSVRGFRDNVEDAEACIEVPVVITNDEAAGSYYDYDNDNDII